MKALGINLSPKEIRYAIVTKTDGRLDYVNKGSENRIVFPANTTEIEDKLCWLYDEIKRVLSYHKDIDIIGIKTREFVGRDSSNLRAHLHYESITILILGQMNIPFKSFLYRNGKTNRSSVKALIEEKVGQSDSYWNEQIAGAALAAILALG